MRASTSTSSSPFIVWVREIPPEGLDRTAQVSAELMTRALADSDADPAASQATARFNLQKSYEIIIARGTLTGQLTLPCSRCLAPASVAIDGAFSVNLVPGPPGGDKDLEANGKSRIAGNGDDGDDVDAIDAIDAADVVTYQDDEINLEETVREELVLALPIAPLCREDCQGLCSRCGSDLNQGPCGCPEQKLEDGRFAALKDLKI